MDPSTLKLNDTHQPVYDVSDGSISAAKQEFDTLLNSSNVISEPKFCHSRASTIWSIADWEQKPALVLLPENTEQVSSILKICHSKRIPVTSFSGGTSVTGALTSTRGGVCVDFQKMDRIIALHKDDFDVVVQPAVSYRGLNEVLQKQGLFFPVDPGPDAKIGGMVGTGCSGTNAYKYGTMKEWVLSVTAVLADGTVIKTRQRARKCSAGYDLTRMIVGSEGTLALVTEVVLKLTAAPRNLHIALATFPDIHAAVRTGIAILGSDIVIDAIEVLDEASMKAINESKLSTKAWEEQTTILLKFTGAQSIVDDQIERTRRFATDNGSKYYEVAPDQETMDTWWGARKQLGNAVAAMKSDPSDVFIACDTTVPISRIGDMIVEGHKTAAAAGIFGAFLAHLGDGNMHFVFNCAKQKEDVGWGLMDDLQKVAIQMEGTSTGEHGVGLIRVDTLVDELGQSTVDLMRKIKISLDPRYILNPDKIIRLNDNIQ